MIECRMINMMIKNLSLRNIKPLKCLLFWLIKPLFDFLAHYPIIGWMKKVIGVSFVNLFSKQIHWGKAEKINSQKNSGLIPALNYVP